MKNEVLAMYIAYMDKVLSHARINYLRKLYRIQDHEVFPGDIPEVVDNEGISLPAETLFQLAEDESMRRAMKSLKKVEAIVLFRVVCLEESTQEVAKDLGITDRSVRRIKSNSILKLRKALNGGLLNDR